MARDDEPAREEQRKRVPLPRHARGEFFLQGPIPWTWLVCASRVPGSSVAVGVALWHLAFRRKNAKISFSATRAGEVLGINRTTVSRGIVALEKAGLIHVERAAGRNLQIQVLKGPTPSGRIRL